MPCQNCGNAKTMRAHLLPKSMCEEVKVGKSFVTGLFEGKTNFPPPVQTGTFDHNILCIRCDGILGEWENEAIKTFRAIRERAIGMVDGAHGTVDGDSSSILRFCAGLLYKYSLTTSKFGRIELGPYQEPLRRVAFESAEIPSLLNVALFRLRLHRDDGSVFAYRAPMNDRDKMTGANMFRVLAGGVFLLIRVDKRPTIPSPLSRLWLRERRDIIFNAAPAQAFEEYRIPGRIIAGSEKLRAILPD